jgi:hypothetical protein
MKYVQRAMLGPLLVVASACAGMNPSLVPAATVTQDERGTAPAQRPAVGGGPLSEPTGDPGVNAAKPAPASAPSTLKRGMPSHPPESIPPTI